MDKCISQLYTYVSRIVNDTRNVTISLERYKISALTIYL